MRGRSSFPHFRREIDLGACQLVVSLQIATGLPALGIVLAFLAEPQWTRSVFGPELVLGFVVAFFVLTLAAIGISFASENTDNTPFITRQRLRITFMTDGIFIVVACLNGFLFREWPLALSIAVSFLGAFLFRQSLRYR